MSRIFANIRVLGAYLGTVVLGIIFIVAAVFIGVSDSDTEYIQITGTVAEINEYYDFDGELQHSVFVDYEVDGQKYEHAEYGSYSSSMKVGDTVGVYYNPEEPEHIQAEGFRTIPYVIGGAGVAAVLLGVFLLVKKVITGV